MRKSNNEFLDGCIIDLRNRQNETLNALQLYIKLLKRNGQKLYLIGGKIFDFF